MQTGTMVASSIPECAVVVQTKYRSNIGNEITGQIIIMQMYTIFKIGKCTEKKKFGNIFFTQTNHLKTLL